MSDNNDFGSFVAGFVVGGLVGAAVAFLLAPQSGEETRTLIRDKGIELKDRAVEYGQDARSRAEKSLDEARIRADEAIKDLRTRSDDLARIAKERAAQIQQSIGVGQKSAEIPETEEGEAGAEEAPGTAAA